MGASYSEELFDEILERISTGESVASICDEEKMPSQRSFYNWLNKDESLVQRYAHAREAQADAIFDDILSIADEARNDWMRRTGEDSEGWQLNGEHIQRSKLRIDARKWMASKLAPKKYGDKLQHTGDGGGPLQIQRVKFGHDPDSQ